MRKGVDVKNKLIEIQKKHSYLAKRSWVLYWRTVASEIQGLWDGYCKDWWHKQFSNIQERPTTNGPDIRMRVWIPYNLKKGLITNLIKCENPAGKDEWKLSSESQWVEFVAVNDPLDRKQDLIDQLNPVKEVLIRTGGEPKWCKCGQVKGHDNGEECIS